MQYSGCDNIVVGLADNWHATREGKESDLQLLESRGEVGGMHGKRVGDARCSRWTWIGEEKRGSMGKLDACNALRPAAGQRRRFEEHVGRVRIDDTKAHHSARSRLPRLQKVNVTHEPYYY